MEGKGKEGRKGGREKKNRQTEQTTVDQKKRNQIPNDLENVDPDLPPRARHTTQ